MHRCKKMWTKSILQKIKKKPPLQTTTRKSTITTATNKTSLTNNTSSYWGASSFLKHAPQPSTLLGGNRICNRWSSLCSQLKLFLIHSRNAFHKWESRNNRRTTQIAITRFHKRQWKSQHHCDDSWMYFKLVLSKRVSEILKKLSLVSLGRSYLSSWSDSRRCPLVFSNCRNVPSWEFNHQKNRTPPR